MHHLTQSAISIFNRLETTNVSQYNPRVQLPGNNQPYQNAAAKCAAFSFKDLPLPATN